MTKSRSTRAARRAAGLMLLAAALAGCTQTPLAPAVAGEDALQGHAQWCGSNPPSGYCSIDDKR